VAETCAENGRLQNTPSGNTVEIKGLQ